MGLDVEFPHDALPVRKKVLLEEPKKACGYTGDQFVDIDEEEKKRKKRDKQEKRKKER